MKSPIIIVILAIVIFVGLWGYMTTRDSDHNGHDHSEHIETAHEHEEYGDHKEHACDDEDAGHDAHDEDAEDTGDDAHDGDDVHEGHEHEEDNGLDAHEDEGQVIALTREEIEEIGLKTAIAGAGTIDVDIILTGEIWVNQDRMAHVVPRVSGVVTEVYKKLGDPVKAGETIAVIDSGELADAKAEYLAAYERHAMARLSFNREERLWKDKISSEEDYLEKKQLLTETGIEKRTAEQKLHAIGFNESYLRKLPDEPQQLLTRYEIKAPFDGTIIDKHIVLGELVGSESSVYIIADLSSVWVDLQVYPKDLKHIEQGQRVIISSDSDIPYTDGVIGYVGPIVGTESRTALARVILSNESGVLRPGLFVTGEVSVSSQPSEVVVSKTAIQSLEGKKCVFIKDAHGFEPAFVEIRRENRTHAAILSGLAAGQEYVTEGAFTLKSKIVTSTLDSHAGHGH